MVMVTTEKGFDMNLIAVKLVLDISILISSVFSICI